MCDVALVSKEMWEHILSPAQQAAMSKSLGLGGCRNTAGLWSAFLAGLHDLGKASPEIQLQVESVGGEVEERLRRNEVRVPTQHRLGLRPTPHGTISAAALQDMLSSEFGLSKHLAGLLGPVSGGNHGTFPGSLQIENAKGSGLGGTDWADLQCS